MQKSFLKSNYNIKIIKKNVKNLTIRINSDAKIVVSAPKFLSNSFIERFIKSKKDWIEKKLKNINLNKIEYKNDDKISFLGKKYILKVIISNKNYIDIKNDKLFLYTKENTVKIKEKILYDWYSLKAKEVFNKILNKYLKKTNQDINVLRIKRMKSRWGSCNSIKKYINLNLELIKYDIKFIEYVVLHEIAHLTHPNHSKAFYNYISNYMPDFKNREKLLI